MDLHRRMLITPKNEKCREQKNEIFRMLEEHLSDDVEIFEVIYSLGYSHGRADTAVEGLNMINRIAEALEMARVAKEEEEKGGVN